MSDKRPRVLGVDVPRDVARRHPAHESTTPPPPAVPAKLSIPPAAQKWAGLAALVAALGGGAGIAQIFKGSAPSAEQVTAIHEDLRRLRSDIRELREHLRQQSRVDAERWDLTAAVLCEINGGAWARGVDCGAVRFDSQPLDQGAAVYVPPKVRARAEWPFARRPP